MSGKALARHGSSTSRSLSLKRRMCSWQTVVPGSGPCGTPFTRNPHAPQMPSRQSESKAIGSLPFGNQPLVDDVEHLEEGHVGRDVLDDVVDELAGQLAAQPAATLSGGFA